MHWYQSYYIFILEFLIYMILTHLTKNTTDKKKIKHFEVNWGKSCLISTKMFDFFVVLVPCLLNVWGSYKPVTFNKKDQRQKKNHSLKWIAGKAAWFQRKCLIFFLSLSAQLFFFPVIGYSIQVNFSSR